VAGWYGFMDTDQYMQDFWNESGVSYGVWRWWGHDLGAAMAHFADCQQGAFDFCRVQTAWET
jgi:hypothetical protein